MSHLDAEPTPNDRAEAGQPVGVGSPKKPALRRLIHLIGLDRSIAYTVLARVIQILGSTGTVLLIVRFLTPTEQGYYYTLYSLVNLNIVFELGFSFVILQLAAHETAYLRILPSGRIRGSLTASRRLASILQKVRRWYSVAAVLMFFTLTPVGWLFFQHRHAAGDSVHWMLPCVLLVFMAALMFQIDPFFSFLEGCGEVANVARLRVRQTGTGVILSWIALVSGHGLYAPAAMLSGNFIMGLLFLYPRRRFILLLLRMDASGERIDWRSEVLPFQTKIAVSWLCNYFTAQQVLTPILFAYCGAVAAGQMGMSMSIVGALSPVALAWMSTKSAPFGAMIHRRESQQLDRVFFRTLWQSTILIAGGAAALVVGLSVLGIVAPKLSARMIPLPLFALLAITVICSHVVQSEALYLRAHKKEPFLIQSVMLALLVTGGAFLLAPHFGVAGVTWTYFLCMGLISLTSGTLIFRNKRREWYGAREPVDASSLQETHNNP